VSEGLKSEFPNDSIIAPNTAASLAGHDEQAILDLCNQLGATQPCVNEFDPPYPKPVAAAKFDAAKLSAALERGCAVTALSPRTWLLAPVAEAAQPAISLTLLEYGRPVVIAPPLARPVCRLHLLEQHHREETPGRVSPLHSAFIHMPLRCVRSHFLLCHAIR
jgi:hypothetical protein